MALRDSLTTLREVAKIVRRPVQLGMRQRKAAGEVYGYQLRGSDIEVFLRDDVGEDVATLVQTFNQDHYVVPPQASAAMASAGDSPYAMDLGANIGMFGAWFLREHPGGRVTAYEADPDNARVHQLTVDANADRRNWELEAAAAGVEDGEVAFVTGWHTNSRLAEPGEDATVVPQHDVLARTKDVDLLKVDIEGAEWAILADKRLKKLPVKVIALEYHPERCPTDDPRALVHERLQAAGYETADADFDATDEHGMVWGWRPA